MPKRVLLDTNIIIHREAYKVSNISVGQLFNWLDRLKHIKCVHPITVAEIEKHSNKDTAKSMGIKLQSYHILKTTAPFNLAMQVLSAEQDKTPNDINDSKLLNEVVENRVDFLITEDRKIHSKARVMGLGDRVYTISGFVEKVISENPELVDYKVLSIKKSYFGNVDINDQFFDSFRQDYPAFNKWFNKKSDEVAYVCYRNKLLVGFLYLKLEQEDENYADIVPPLPPGRRLKIGTLKVALNGYRIGERFLKIAFDNALLYEVDEIYVTIFDHTPEQLKLIELLEEWGFKEHGIKNSATSAEKVYIRDFRKRADRQRPKLTFPYLSKAAKVFFVPIWPDYHTELLPDSILNTESPKDFTESEPHRNALSKVYISHSHERNLQPGDIILFYRTGGYYAGVATTIGIVEKVHQNIQSAEELFEICRKKTFFTHAQLQEFWNRYKNIKPFVVEFLYAYSLPKRPNLASLIRLNIIKDVTSVPRGFHKITWDELFLILKESKSNENIIVN
jgi:predicted nucleic acid-binding protein